MQDRPLKERLRSEIVQRSIGILRAHGKKDAEIREMLRKDFSLSDAALDDLLRAEEG